MLFVLWIELYVMNLYDLYGVCILENVNYKVLERGLQRDVYNICLVLCFFWWLFNRDMMCDKSCVFMMFVFFILYELLNNLIEKKSVLIIYFIIFLNFGYLYKG